MGSPDREPLKIGGFAGQYGVGMSAFSGTMVALHVRDLEGFGQQVDVSAMEAMAMSQIHSSIRYQFSGQNGGRSESMLVPAMDGWVSPGLERRIPDDTWRSVCDLIEMPELIVDERFATQPARIEHRQEMLAVLTGWIARQAKEDVYHSLQALRTIAGYVATVEDLFTSRQLAVRGFFQSAEHPVAGELLYPSLPFRWDGETQEPKRAPLLGEHNMEIYRDRLGYTQEEIARLQRQKVV
jgi:crotonobetainyl-CoA:carnitine CoA-transferase CaiB-like acyl-CoA transferase